MEKTLKSIILMAANYGQLDNHFVVTESLDELKAKLNSLTAPYSFIEIEHISNEYLDDISMDSSKQTLHRYIINTAHIVKMFEI